MSSADAGGREFVRRGRLLSGPPEGGGQRAGQRELGDLVIAPLLVGQSDAVWMVGPAHCMGAPSARLRHRHRLLETRTIRDKVLLRYAPKDISTEPR
ncbi:MULTISPECIES: hypothetical protein [Streptomyces]|uniref:hypothetical protein n=1 Tax=Streptomyces TaxID=1883 RepID=UPI001C5DA7C5|nr:hypothetical protein [Streptomyces poriferorum]